TKFCIYCGVAVVPNAQPARSVPPPPSQQQQQQPPPNYGQQIPQYAPQYQQFQPPPPPVLCRICGGFGQGLPEKAVMCKECRWLRPRVPGYAVDNSAFAWAADAKAMAALRAIKPLNAAAKVVSEKVGRRWIEVT